VLAISGRIGAGKSSLAAELHKLLGWPRASFGEFVRAEANRRQLVESRENLQDLGAELITTLGWPEFCARTLAAVGLGANSVPCVVEGVRHVDALTALRDFFAPVPVYLVHVEVPDEQRAQRMASEGIDSRQAEGWAQHSTERDVAHALPAAADVRVATAGTVEEAVRVVSDWLESGSSG